MALRGVTLHDVEETVRGGETFPAKFGRTGFRRNLRFGGTWRGRQLDTKQVEVYAVVEDGAWLVISVVARYF